MADREGVYVEHYSTCTITGCDRPHIARSWCTPHYKRWRRYGDPMAGGPVGPPRVSSRVGAVDRRCPRCKVVKQLTEFYCDRKRPDGVTCYCKACINAYDIASRQRDPEKYFAIRRRSAYKRLLWAKFRLTVEQYEALLTTQDGVCAICKRPETASRRRVASTRLMSVDHDHRTGVVRGILCRACNSGLGNFQDDVAQLAAAIDYLTRAPT